MHGKELAILLTAALALLPAAEGRAQAEITRQAPGKKLLAPEHNKSYKNDPSLTAMVSDIVQLAEGPVTLRIFFEPRFRGEAEYTLRKAGEYLPAVERELQSPLHPPAGTISIYGKGAVCGGYDDINSSLENALGNPALAFHELGHLWFLDQGAASFLPVALARAGKLALTQQEIISIENAWGYRYVHVADDFPLEKYEEPRYRDYEEYAAVVYNKTFKIQYLLFRELGIEKYFSFLRKWRTQDQNDYAALVAVLNESGKKPWRDFLSGWIFEGGYKVTKPDDFKDSDRDGLLDAEEVYEGTDINNIDTDGDGYADGWETARGLNPLDKDSRGNAAVPAVDGVAEALTLETVSVKSDSTGDSKASADIRLVEVYRAGRQYLVRAALDGNDARDVTQTIHLRNLKGYNYWIQSADAKTVWISEFPDGLPFEQWKKSGIDPARVAMAAGSVFEFLFDPADFGLGDEFAFTYIAGGYNGDTAVWDSDIAYGGIVYGRKPFVRIDGDGADMAGAVSMKSVPDPAGDAGGGENSAAARFADIREFLAGREHDTLYLCTLLDGGIPPGDDLITTFHIQFPAERYNYWVQFIGRTLVGFSRFSDGMPFEKWINAMDRPAVQDIRFDYARDLEAALPVSLFSEIKRIGSFRVKVILGGNTGGNGTAAATSVWNLDESAFADLD